MVNLTQNHQAQQVFFPLLLSRVISLLLLPSPSFHFALPPLGKDNPNPLKGLNYYTSHRPTTALFGPRHFHPQNVHTLLSLLSNITFSPHYQEYTTNPSLNPSLPFQTPFTFLSIPIHHIDRMRLLHNLLLKQQQPNLMPTQIHFIMPDSPHLKATSLLLEARVTFLSSEEIQRGESLRYFLPSDIHDVISQSLQYHVDHNGSDILPIMQVGSEPILLPRSKQQHPDVHRYSISVIPS